MFDPQGRWMYGKVRILLHPANTQSKKLNSSAAVTALTAAEDLLSSELQPLKPQLGHKPASPFLDVSQPVAVELQMPCYYIMITSTIQQLSP